MRVASGGTATSAEEARKRMKIKDGKPVVPAVTLDDPETKA